VAIADLHARVRPGTDAARRDPLTATPYHKHVNVRLRPMDGLPDGAPVPTS